MKNKEKYKDKILEIALQHDVVAVDETNNSVKRCNEMPYCNHCLFHNSEDESRSCDDEKFIKWLDEEEDNNTPIKLLINDDKDEGEPPFDKLECDSNACEYRWLYELNDEEYGFLKIVENGYIARDMIDDDLTFYCEAPTWKNRRNINKGYWFSICDNVNLKDDAFDFIKAGECWAYNVNTQIKDDSEKIYNITKDLREDII